MITLDEQISYLLEEKDRTHLDIARGNAHRVAMFEAVIATLRSVKQAEPDGWVLVQSKPLSLFSCWWAMIEASRELNGDPRLTDDQVVLQFMGNGGSCMVTAGNIRAMLAAAPAAPQSGWVSVEERLPKEGEWILAYNGAWCGVARFFASRDKYEKWEDEHTTYIETSTQKVTHWMPLPAAPGREG